MPAGGRDDLDAIGLAAPVARALDALAPCIAAMIADEAVSGEHAMHIVVMDPAARGNRVPFESAILAERSVGDRAAWKADYAHYARAKARLAWREGASTADIVDDAPARLVRGDLVVEGAVCRHGWIVAASGAHPWYDTAFATMAIELVNATLRHAVADARTRGGTW
jgi:hypothetical protein